MVCAVIDLSNPLFTVDSVFLVAAYNYGELSTVVYIKVCLFNLLV